MTTTHHDRPRRARPILLALLSSAVVATSASGADEVKAKAKSAKAITVASADSAPADGSAKAKLAADAIRDLDRLLKSGDQGEAKKTIPALAERPKRSVTPPKLDSAVLDDLIEKALAKSKVPVSPQTTDEEFVRRAYLDVVGKLPTIEEMRAFVLSRDKAKRAKLVDHLLQSDEYAENWARYWRDVVSFRAPEENANKTNFPAFESWMAGKLKANRPWDEIATGIITADGTAEENGAVSFGLAEMGQAVEIAGEVSRVFMGIQIQCAQCHDHPSDPWKREQFHEFASFFAGLAVRNQADKGEKRVFAIVEAKNVPRYTMPDKADPTKQIPVNPKFFLSAKAPTVAGLKVEGRRALAASYITGQDNPWFAKAFVNRAWGSLMGEGFFNPVDDLGPTKEGHDPEILDALAAQWQQGGYDIRWLFRTILLTKAYQREARSTQSASGRTPFAANCPGRLRADQIFDNLAQALGIPADSFPGRGGKAGAARRQEAIKAMVAAKVADQPKAVQQVAAATVAQRNAPRTKFGRTFGVDPSTPTDDVLGTIPQALYLMNSPAVNNNIKANNASMLGEVLRSTPDNRAVLEVLYLRVLARRPNAREVNLCGRYLESVGDRVEGFEDILWGLINSTEFVSRR